MAKTTLKRTTNKSKEFATVDSSKELSVLEKKSHYELFAENNRLKFEEAMAKLQFIDPTKSYSKTYTTFSKDTLRTYMKNPLSNAKNLRSLSKFLYYRSQAYRRLVNYYSNMINLDYRSVVPITDLVKGMDATKMLKSYNETLVSIENAGLNVEFLKVFINVWISDMFCGCAYVDDETGGWFIYPLDPDYCQIVGVEADGSFAFSHDMTYWRSRQTELEMMGEPFTSMYNNYGGNNANRWQLMPPEYSVCIKYNVDDWQNNIPPFLALFNSLINLSDLEDIQAIADAQNIYKLLVATIPLNSNSDGVDDFALDIDTAIDFYSKVIDKLPDYTDAILAPFPISPITFDKDTTSDINSVQKATKSFYTTSGAGQILDTGSISGQTAITGAMVSDEQVALNSILPQVERIVNRILSYRISNPAKVKFLKVTEQTKTTYIDNLVKGMNYGMPTALTLGTMMGYSELELLSMSDLNEALGLADRFKPLATASTQSGASDTGGRPTSSDDTISDDGAASRDKKDSAS